MLSPEDPSRGTILSGLRNQEIQYPCGFISNGHVAGGPMDGFSRCSRGALFAGGSVRLGKGSGLG